jgi:hypothetical protein
MFSLFLRAQYACQLHAIRYGQWMEAAEKCDPVLGGPGWVPDPWTEIYQRRHLKAGCANPGEVFTLDGTFECGLIARHP